jgi:hypothetical protein
MRKALRLHWPRAHQLENHRLKFNSEREHSTKSFYSRSSFRQNLFFLLLCDPATDFGFSLSQRSFAAELNKSFKITHGKFMGKFSPSVRMRFSLKMCMNCVSLTIIFHMNHMNKRKISPRLTRLSNVNVEVRNSFDFKWRNSFLEQFLSDFYTISLITSRERTLTMTAKFSKLPKIFLLRCLHVSAKCILRIFSVEKGVFEILKSNMFDVDDGKLLWKNSDEYCDGNQLCWDASLISSISNQKLLFYFGYV